MALQKGRIIVTDGIGNVTAVPSASNGMIPITDSTQQCGMNFVSILSAVYTNVVLVDKSGNNSTGARNGKPFLTIAAGLAAALSGDIVIINPGTYAETPTIPSGVVAKGHSPLTTIISMTGVISATDLVTLASASSCLSGVSLNLTSTSHVILRGIVMSSTSATSSSVSNCSITIDNSGAGAGTSAVYGIHSTGTGVTPNYSNTFSDVVCNVLSTGSGNKRGILVDTGTASINCNRCSFRSSGGTNSIGAEINIASANLTIRNSYCEGTTADVSQTAGTLNLGNTKLQNSLANSLNFTTVDTYPSIIRFNVSGGVSQLSTSYVSAGAMGSEAKQTIFQKCIAKNLYIRSRTAPGVGINDVYTIRKNGVNTTLTATLAASGTAVSNIAVSVTFSAGDDLSLQLVTGLSLSADVVVTLELY